MNIWRPYTQMKSARGALDVESGKDSHLTLKNGERIFDGISSWWLITHGHCHPAISHAIAKQSEKLDQVIFANFMHEPAEELVHELKTVLPAELNTIFFSDNGSTAVEVAMKMAYQYCQLIGQKEKRTFCSFRESYHGDTFGAMSVTGDGLFTNPYSELRLKIIRCDQGQHLSDPIEAWVNSLKRNIEERHLEIAAVILEPMIQGAAGMIVWPKEAVQKICAICREFDVLLIFDEVMTGFGRTGKLFAFQHVTPELPDFVCLSKGLTGGSLPLALTLTKQKIYDAFLSDEVSKTFFHGHSFTANAISCAAAVASVRLFKTEPVMSKIDAINVAHQNGIQKLAASFDLVDSRVCGAIGAIELRDFEDEPIGYGSEKSLKIFDRCMQQGLFVRPLGRVLYLMPPYCSDPSEVEWAWETIRRSLHTD